MKTTTKKKQQQKQQKKPQPVKMQTYGTQFQWIYLKDSPTPRLREHYRREGRRLYLPEISETTPMKFHQYDCSNVKWKIIQMGMPKQTGTKSPQPYTKGKRSGLPQGRAQHLVFLWQTVSIENIHIFNITQREQVISIYICNINLWKRIHEFLRRTGRDI